MYISTHKAARALDPVLMGCRSPRQPIRLGSEAPAASEVSGVGVFNHSPLNCWCLKSDSTWVSLYHGGASTLMSGDRGLFSPLPHF